MSVTQLSSNQFLKAQGLAPHQGKRTAACSRWKNGNSICGPPKAHSKAEESRRVGVIPEDQTLGRRVTVGIMALGAVLKSDMAAPLRTRGSIGGHTSGFTQEATWTLPGEWRSLRCRRRPPRRGWATGGCSGARQRRQRPSRASRAPGRRWPGTRTPPCGDGIRGGGVVLSIIGLKTAHIPPTPAVHPTFQMSAPAADGGEGRNVEERGQGPRRHHRPRHQHQSPRHEG